MKPGSQCDRLHKWLKANPGSSSLEITKALNLVNVTGRVSDLRAEGIDVAVDRDESGTFRYRVREPGPMTLGFERIAS